MDLMWLLCATSNEKRHAKWRKVATLTVIATSVLPSSSFSQRIMGMRTVAIRALEPHSASVAIEAEDEIGGGATVEKV